jgi:4-hydroxy-tetrahydrodipicolinate synthase
MARFGRVATAMVTPFTDDGSLDVDGAVALARWLVDQGAEGLVLAGTTGESPTLTDAEKLTLWETVAEAVTVPIVAGSGTNDTAHSVHLTAEASKLGVAGILALCPYYNRPSQAGIEGHLRAIAEATDLPVVIYDIPVRTGRKVSTPLLVRLAHEVDNILGVKDAAGSPAETAQLVAAAPTDFEVYCGDDALLLPLLSVGAVGLIGVATHWCTPEVVALLDCWEAGDVAGARALNTRLLESWTFETGDECPNPGPAKAMLRHLGQPAGRCRPPMDAEPPWVADAAVDVYTNLEAARG